MNISNPKEVSKVTKPEHLDSVVREEKASILSNAIAKCMMDNRMTLENLDEASEIVRNVYRKNAVMIQREADGKPASI